MRRTLRRFLWPAARVWDYLLADTAERLAWVSGRLRKSRSFLGRCAKKLEKRVSNLLPRA
jgi:hypothetical protein